MSDGAAVRGMSVSRSRRRLDRAVSIVRALLQGATWSDLRVELLERLFEYEEYARLCGFVKVPPPVVTSAASAAVPFPLLVTTNKGLFVLVDGRWRCLLPVTCFGLARHGEMLYLGVSAGIYSLVLSGRLAGQATDCVLGDLRVLLQYETRYGNERIHQLAYDPIKHQVIVANCRRNSLLVVDPGGAGVVDEKFLFVDGTGFPVYTDQNHINSVACYGDMLLFTSHSAGPNSGALGFVADDEVRAYAFGSRGLHDIVLHDGALMFTDSFRDAQAAANPSVSGAIRFRGHEYLADVTDAVEGKLVLRGLAVRDTLVAVGYSAFAPRERRHEEGRGGVIVADPNGSGQSTDGPFSQVYDILPFDGARGDRVGAPLGLDALDELFRRDVGPLLYRAPVARSARVAKLR